MDAPVQDLTHPRAVVTETAGQDRHVIVVTTADLLQEGVEIAAVSANVDTQGPDRHAVALQEGTATEMIHSNAGLIDAVAVSRVEVS